MVLDLSLSLSAVHSLPRTKTKLLTGYKESLDFTGSSASQPLLR